MAADVHEVVAQALSGPAEVLKGLGEPTRGALKSFCRVNDLTILNILWAPSVAIGIYTGREDNICRRRVPGGNG